VWDLSVDVYGNYLANNIFHKNSGKTTWAASAVVRAAVENPGSVIMCFAQNADVSIRQQQSAVYDALPAEMRQKLLGAEENVSYTRKNGFSKSSLILPGSKSHIIFKTYAQYLNNDTILEGAELGSREPVWINIGAWCDEYLVGPELLATLRFRLATRNAKLIVTFTPIDGYTEVVRDYLAGARTLESKEAELLGGRKVPFIQKSANRNAGIIYFHSKDNPFGGYERISQDLKGRPEDEILTRAYGVPTKSASSRFPLFSREVNVIAHEKIPTRDVTRYMVLDPAGRKNWFMCWIAVDATETYYVYREWPDINVGPWAKWHGGKWIGGEGSKGLGYGIRDYVDMIVRNETGEDIFERLIDPRLGAAKYQAQNGASSIIEDLASDSDMILPGYTTDPQEVPYCFRRVMMTAQQLRNKQATEGWDADWVEYVIEKCGESNDPVDFVRRTQYVSRMPTTYTNNELYEIIYGYQRLIDEEDNAEGIYCTVFHKNCIGREGTPDYAKHELLNGYEDYPFVITKLAEDNKRLYDVASFPQMLKGVQWQVKTERDSRIDRNSLATLPPLMHPMGSPPADWGPGRYVPYRRQGEIQFGPVPQYNPGSVEMENTQLEQADKLVGLEIENPLSTIQQQFFVDKFLCHVRDVLRLAYKCYQRFGPDEVFFRVTGTADPQRFNKGDPNENFDIILNFDVLQTDPENVEMQLNQFVSMLQLDKNGRINIDTLLEMGAAAINPVMADAIIRPAEQAQEQVVKNVTDDLTKISSAIEVGARPNGAQIAMQLVSQYAQQPDVAQRLSQDKAFAERLQKYYDQYQFQMQQAQNAQIGRVGTQPAAVGGMQTQGMMQ